MLKFTLACAISTAAALQAEEVVDLPFGFTNNRYYDLSAEDKYDSVMAKLKEDQTAAPYRYDIGPFLTVRTASSTTVFSEEFNHEKETKLAHQQGTVAGITYVPVGDHPYTGFYAGGGNYGILRLSESGFIIPGRIKSNPSLAIKLFSDGVRTPNFNAMIDFNDQDTYNFFPKDDEGNFKPFTNHPNPPNNDCAIHTMGSKFMDSSFTGFSIGASSFAIRNEQGGDKGNSSQTDYYGYYWPFEVQFVPNEAAIPEYIDGQTPLEYISTIKKVEGEPLFDVLAREDPGSDLEKIAEIWLKEDMFQSYWGDTRFYFQHDPFSRDCNRWKGTDFPEKAKEWKGEITRRMRELGLRNLEPWDRETPIPEYPDGMTAQETIEGGILGTVNPDGMTGCPFAWVLQ